MFYQQVMIYSVAESGFQSRRSRVIELHRLVYSAEGPGLQCSRAGPDGQWTLIRPEPSNRTLFQWDCKIVSEIERQVEQDRYYLVLL